LDKKAAVRGDRRNQFGLGENPQLDLDCWGGLYQFLP
jgi:hypothetical protein